MSASHRARRRREPAAARRAGCTGSSRPPCRRDEPRRDRLHAQLEDDDLLLDRRADHLPAGVRVRLRRADHVDRRIGLQAVRRDRDRRDRGAVLVRLPRDVRDVPEVPLPAHVRRVPGGAGRHGRDRRRRRCCGSGCAPGSTATCRCSWRSRSGSTRDRPPCWCRSSASSPAARSSRSASRSPRWRSRSTTSAYVTSGILTPMFLTAGTFFPISSFPPAIEALARLNPLYHCVQLVRDVVVLGIEPLADLGHLAFLVAFGLGAVAAGDLADAQAADRLRAALRAALLRRRRLAVCVAGGGAGGGGARRGGRVGAGAVGGACSRRGASARGR